MKTVIKMALAGLATVLFATVGSAIADDSGWVVIDNHHGSRTYLQRPTQWQTRTTVGVYAQGRGLGQADTGSQRDDQRIRHFSTGQGTVSYVAPVR
jgi:hypothetical protein